MTDSLVLYSHGRSAAPDVSRMGETGAVVRHLAHELRQPLSTLETSAYYLKLILAGGNPRADAQINKIQQVVQNMSWIISDVVHYVQATAPQPQWVDFPELVSEAVVNLSISDSVKLDCDESLPHVLFDLSQAQHLVRVLLTVLRQVAFSQSTIHVSVRRSGSDLVLRSSAATSEIFCERSEDLLLPFTPHLPAESCLALASVQRIAEAHNGRVAVEALDSILTVEVMLAAPGEP